MLETSAILEVRELKVQQGGTQILKGIDWRIQPGEHWAILGANGCGKTSLLAAIAAYLTPSSGSVHFLGDAYGETDWNEVRHQMGIVSSALARRVPADEPAIETVLSGESAQLGFWTREKTVDTRKALRCLGKMGVRTLADRLWGVLSQGERQKVFIARALMTDPKLLILDEPCAGLDPVARERFLQSLQKLAGLKKGPSLVLVTHHIEEIIPEITHVLILKKGKVLAAGRKEAVLKSGTLSEAFGAELKVHKLPKKDRWTLQLK